MAPADLPPDYLKFVGGYVQPDPTLYHYKTNLAGQGAQSQRFSVIGYSPSSQPQGQGTAMSNGPTHAEIDAKLGRLSAETDTKFEKLLNRIDSSNLELKGEIGKVSVRLEGLEGATRGTKTTIIGTGIAAVALVIAILSLRAAMVWHRFVCARYRARDRHRNAREALNIF